MITLRPLKEGEKFRADGKYALIARVYHQDPAHPVYEIIDTPQPERDWSDVVDRLVDFGLDARSEHILPKEFRMRITRILQQADKPAPVKRKVKRWVSVYKDGSMNIEIDRIETDKWNAENRIACKEIEIEYFEGENL